MANRLKISSLTKLFSTKKKQRPPQKRQPDEYFKQLWLPKRLSDDIALVAELEKVPFRQAGLSLLSDGFINYLRPLMREYIMQRTEVVLGVVPYRKPDRKLQIIRKFLDDHGVYNPRIDNWYKLI